MITSNRTRDVHDALKRRCLYHWVEHPDFEREVAIVRAAGARGRRARSPARWPPRSPACAALGLYKPPGVAETIDWAAALDRARPRPSSTTRRVDATLGTVLKYREDQERVRAARHRRARAPGGPAVAPDRGAPSPSRSRGCCAAPGSTSRSAATRRRSPRRSARSGVERRGRVYWAGRADAGRTGPRTSPVYDRAFAAFWHDRGSRRRHQLVPTADAGRVDDDDDDGAGSSDDDDAATPSPVARRCATAPRGAAAQGLRRLHDRPSSTRPAG